MLSNLLIDCLTISVTDDIVKVEIWDIVDKGKVKKRDGLKMDTEEADVVLLLVS